MGRNGKDMLNQMLAVYALSLTAPVIYTGIFFVKFALESNKISKSLVSGMVFRILTPIISGATMSGKYRASTVTLMFSKMLSFTWSSSITNC
eukprot:Skav225956  [mRNA]  locus=scaffold6030:11730:13458:+ [translate_table: standard]